VLSQSTSPPTLPPAFDGCQGGIDLYFVCDNSGSVGTGMQTSGVTFLRDIITQFWDAPNFRTEIIYFSSSASRRLPLTGDQSLISAELDRLTRVTAGGSTFPSYGLNLARQTMESVAATGRQPISLLFFLSDGAADSSNLVAMVDEANLIKQLGYYIFALGIGSGIVEAQLLSVVSLPQDRFYFTVDNYAALPAIAVGLAEEFCLEVDRVSSVTNINCIEQNGTLTTSSITFDVRGSGFDPTYILNPNRQCRFVALLPNSNAHPPLFYPAAFISSTRITCILNLADTNIQFSADREYQWSLEVSMDGVLYTQTASIAQFTVPLCPLPPVPLVLDPETLIIIGAAAALLLLCCLWWFWPLLFGTAAVAAVAGGSAVAAAAPASVPAGGKGKWAKVDTSSYIWATSGGGAAPLKTQWGELGATGSAPMGDAKIVEVDGRAPKGANIQADPSDSEQKKGCCSCWTNCCNGISNCYSKCAGMRPTRAAPQGQNEGLLSQA